MSSLLVELTFIETDAAGVEFHKTFPAGTPVAESRDFDLKWQAEIKTCEKSCEAFARKEKRRNYEVMFLGGRPRILHRRYYDSTFKDEISNSKSEISNRDGTLTVGECDRQTLATDALAVMDDTAAAALADCEGSEDVNLKSQISNLKSQSSSDPLGDEDDGVGPTLSSPPSLGIVDKGFEQYGLVVVIDLLNLLVRAFHVGTPTRIHAVKSMLFTCANIIERLSPEYLIFAADGGHVARSKMYPAYKAHRPPKPQELIDQITLAERAIEAIGWPLIRVRDWEADDVIASLASSISARSAGFVVCSCDKDLLQLCEGSLPVKVYHPWDQGKYLGAKHVEEKYGLTRGQLRDYLSLVGDASDGVPGVKGVGPKKASELLSKYPTLESILEAARVLHIVGSAGKTIRESVEVARMSHKLVTLHTGLRIPFTWHDLPASSPSAGWVESLRKLELGGVVQRLSDVIPTTGRVRSGTSRIEVTCEQPEQQFPAVPDRVERSVTAVPPIESLSARVAGPSDSDSQSDATSIEHGANHATPSGDRDGLDCRHGNQDQSASRSLVDPLGESAAWVQDEPPLARTPHGDRLAACRSVYANAWRESDRFLRDGIENGWKSGTDFNYYEDLGRKRLPFVYPPPFNPERERPAEVITPKAAPAARELCLF